MFRIKKFGGIFLVFIFMFIFGFSVKGEEPFYNITNLSLKTSEAEIGGKVYVDLKMLSVDKSTKIMGYFINNQQSYVSLPLHDIDSNKPYFEVSSYMQSGTIYRLGVIEVTDSKGKISYSTTPGGNMPYMNLNGNDEVAIKSSGNKITDFQLIGSNNVPIDGKLRVKLSTEKEVDFCTISLQNKDIESSKALVSIKTNSESVIDLTKLGTQTFYPGDYYISDVFLEPNNQSKYIHYAVNPKDSTALKLDYNLEFSVKEEQNVHSSANTLLNSLSLKSNSARLNDKVYVDLDTNSSAISGTLIFTNETESMIVSLKDIASNPYFVVPLTTKEGLYNLDYVILKDLDGKEQHYRKGEDFQDIIHFDFNSSLTVSNDLANGNILNLDNDKIFDEIIQKLRDLDDNIVIELNADNNPIVTKELFETIKGTNKTLVVKYKNIEWTFNGLDVKNPKQVDVSSVLYDSSEDNNFSDVVSNGFVLEFPDNGKLPGKCLIRMYTTDYIFKMLNNNNANIYYYNENLAKFEIVKQNVQFDKDGYYEFYISHNSQYLISTNKVANMYLSSSNSKDKKVTGFKFDIMTIALCSVIGILCLVIIVLVIKKNKRMV